MLTNSYFFSETTEEIKQVYNKISEKYNITDKGNIEEYVGILIEHNKHDK